MNNGPPIGKANVWTQILLLPFYIGNLRWRTGYFPYPLSCLEEFISIFLFSLSRKVFHVRFKDQKPDNKHQKCKWELKSHVNTERKALLDLSPFYTNICSFLCLILIFIWLPLFLTFATLDFIQRFIQMPFHPIK